MGIHPNPGKSVKFKIFSSIDWETIDEFITDTNRVLSELDVLDFKIFPIEEDFTVVIVYQE